MGKTYKDIKYRKKGGLMSPKAHKDKRMRRNKRGGYLRCKDSDD